MRKKMITAIRQEGLQTRSVSYIFTVHDDKIADLPGTIKKACIAYANTASGFRNYQQNCHCFNWGDVDFVPNSFFLQYGIEKDEMLVDEQLTVDYYEQLVSDENLKFSDKKWQTLKQELFMNGAEALEDFIGTELDKNLEKASIEKMLDEIADQMPDEELYQFYSKYCLTEQVAKEQRIQKLVEEISMKNYYFTFSGADMSFPYQNGYLVVRAENEKEAFRKFRFRYPDPYLNCLCCAFWYTQEKWDAITINMGKCHEIIE